ncbi:mechanosensitive ion channel family protein [Desulfovibrio gilichinskyi]|uniref:Small-conductance mechanosensitive channel n=1 Tax=Desulfovibrio gilichinskyi TaxID=1519643 RepID=A0A1X7C0Q2_9BACT|nr:mechanosensitive ion channel family protein [Desulfovibrio gilichinskyi]SME87857.1 Small-conductance mechanosensitive channel [Desulfovibrio gilichinskyi]
MKKIYIPALTIIIFLVTSIIPSQITSLLSVSTAQAEQQAYQDDPKDGLRDCFLSFQEDMINYEKGQLESKENIFDRLQLPEHINTGRAYSYLLKNAKQIFLVVQSLILDYETDIPDAPLDKDTAEITMYTEDQDPVTFELIKNAQGTWIFSAKTIESPEIYALYTRIHDRFLKLTRANMEGETFDINLMSPYKTMIRLRSGVMGRYGLTLDDAAQTLDLSEIEPALREDLGKTLAVRLYRILHFESPLNIEQLSVQPNTETIPVFLVDPGFGVISMHLITDTMGIKSWKFTPKSLEVVRNTYDDYIKSIIDKGNHPFIGKNLTIDVKFDDLIQSRFRYLKKELLGIDIWKFISLFILIILTPIVSWVISWISNGIMNVLRRKSPNNSLAAFTNQRVSRPLTVISIGYLWTSGLLFMITSEDGAAFLLVIMNIIMIIAEVWLATTVILVGAQLVAGSSKSQTGGTVVLVIGQVLKIIVIIIGITKIAGIFGQDSTRVIAALGISGVAIALAGKNTVENIFGTMMIVTTRPFAIGHFIIIEKIEGEVEHVGLRSTTIRTFYNSLVTVPNSHFITSPVDNMSKRDYRLFKTSIGVAYDTPPEKMIAFTEGLREIVMNSSKIDSKRPHIRVNDFGSSSIDIIVYLHLHVSNREEELILREKFILDAINLAKRLEIEFAFPSRTVYMRNEEMPSHQPMGGEQRAASLGREAASLLLKEQKDATENEKD